MDTAQADFSWQLPYKHWLSENRQRQYKPDLKPGMIDFCSNDYLNMTQHPIVKQAAIEAIQNYGAGSSGARLLSGNCPLQDMLEVAISDYLNKESCLLFNTGFQANSTVIPALLSVIEKAVVFVDKRCHASIYQGLIGVKFQRFRHNDMRHLENLLKAAQGKPIFIITEHLFSMDGAFAPLEQLVHLKQKYKAVLYLDTAHSFGIAAPQQFECVDIIMGAFGKAMGSMGAFVATSQTIISFLKNACRGFIYTTALPPASLATTLKALELGQQSSLADSLLQKARLFRNMLQEKGYDIAGSESYIIPVVSKQADYLEKKLLGQGIRCAAIHPPTTPTKRLRFSVTAQHIEKDFQKVLAVLDGIP